ncbi:hypothetical protein EH165_01700 [Nakamurella antarctica]|uniref:Uncharacterized protein n=1 Tax=Nakamurella antarctica TaxID=1902245 RepID=A0A3G8ZTE9_9ACTN|nr:hypothetical protein [Nakamurella antarctica]AZI57071.1 hypothetical protein EH165_01700 [Nakamurella antarctica]
MIAPINFTWTTTRERADVRAWVVSSVADTLRRSGYRITADSPDELVMARRPENGMLMLLISVWAFLLSNRRDHQVVFKFTVTPTGLTQMLVIGDLPTRVSKILEGLPQA